MSRLRDLLNRPFDLVLTLTFSFFTISSLFFDILNGLNLPLSADSPAWLCRITYELYAKDTDPLLIANPSFVQYATFISALVFGPFYVLFVYGFIYRKNWIRLPGLLYASALTYSMIYYFYLQFFNPENPELIVQNPLKFILWNGPYLLVPILMGIRMRKPNPFAK
jgi:hypothetical protein